MKRNRIARLWIARKMAQAAWDKASEAAWAIGENGGWRGQPREAEHLAAVAADHTAHRRLVAADVAFFDEIAQVIRLIHL